MLKIKDNVDLKEMKVLLYCTKGKPYLYHIGVEKWWYNEGCYEPFDYREGFEIFDELKKENRYKYGDKDVQIGALLNGKIVAECEIDKVEGFDITYPVYFSEVKDELEHITKGSCLSLMNLHHYLGTKKGYALHLSNVKVLDKPLSFDKDYIYKDYKSNALITKAPQNMCNVYDRFGNHYVLISIQPQHLVNILNGKKTIEIRKQILNVMKEKNPSAVQSLEGYGKRNTYIDFENKKLVTLSKEVILDISSNEVIGLSKDEVFGND